MVLFHAAPGLVPSGFVGVDIFFVISGYLIGGIIYSAMLSDSFSFADFYARRARRILPALIAVISFVSVVSMFFFDTKEMNEYAGQSAMALAGLSNFYFWEHTDYFAADSSYEPLLMTWSLGVEEQFYVVFPFFLIIVSRLKARARVAFMLLAVALSFSLSLYMAAHYPISAFYLLPPRAWEMAAGALLAIIHHDTPRTRAIAGRNVNIAASVGLATLFVSMLLFDEHTQTPGWAISLAAAGTVTLIQTRQSALNTWFLSAAPFVFIARFLTRGTCGTGR